MSIRGEFKKNSFLQTIVSCPKISQSNQFFVPVAILHIGEGGDNIWSVVKVVLWSRGGVTWRSQVGANPIPIPIPL